jgi:hypothetical protein
MDLGRTSARTDEIEPEARFDPFRNADLSRYDQTHTEPGGEHEAIPDPGV